MRRTYAVALALVALAAVAPAHAAKHGKRCAVAGSKTLFANQKVRVFTRTYGPDRLQRTQVCRMSDGRHFGLAQDVSDSSRSGVGLIGIAGDWMSYAVGQSTKETTTGSACRFRVSAGSRHCAGGLDVHGVGVTGAGTLAWLADSGVDSSGTHSCCTVFRLDRGKRQPVELDHGLDIDRTSFAIGGHWAYWTKAGEPRSAPLP
ncbi:MAG TPA: hypothetical protein VJT75_06590 [Thermoleophilaceae bacterium]|nr:hypothetical protein [Thermoleophilaceae bacterium]